MSVELDFKTLQSRECGGLDSKGVRCQKRIPAGRTVCDHCSYTAALDWVKNPEGRRVLAALLYDDEIDRARVEGIDRHHI